LKISTGHSSVRLLYLGLLKKRKRGNMTLPRTKLIALALEQKIYMKSQEEIAAEAARNIKTKNNYTPTQIKAHFDELIYDSEKEAYTVFLKYEHDYGKKVIQAFIDSLISKGEIKDLKDVSLAIGKNFKFLDSFFLSMAQSRKSRAGKTFESFHNNLFKTLGYPFDEQAVINGKPDFLMPSAAYYHVNPMDCIIFTSKRTLRERWRQIVTEGTRGLGFFLATIDTKVSENQLQEMIQHRIYLVVPQQIKMKFYSKARNVISFCQFFKDHLDPSVKRWRRNKVI
jgi:hypothetical protein